MGSLFVLVENDLPMQIFLARWLIFYFFDPNLTLAYSKKGQKL